MSSSAQKRTLSKQDESLALEIYVQALELPSDKRRAFLDANAGKPHIQLYVENLLSENTKLASFLSVAPEVSNEDMTSGDVIGNFRIRRLLGKGGLAKVYLAHDLVLSRLVALKISQVPFPHEGRLLAGLDHPHIVRVYSQSDGGERRPHYLCMQYVPGLTLGRCIEAFETTQSVQYGGGKLIGLLDEARQDETVLLESGIVNRQALKELDAVDMVLHIGVQLADALHYAHENKVLHLDIKPENIIINRYGQPMLMDFNVSVAARPNVEQGLIGGTFHYMSPEQKRLFETGDSSQVLELVDARSDIYSLGMVLKEFLDSVIAGQSVSAEVKQVLEKAMAASKEDRFQSSKEFGASLSTILTVRNIQRKLPKRIFLERLAKRRPFLFWGVWGALPILGANRGLRMDLEANIFPRMTAAEISGLYSLAFPAVALLLTALGLWAFGVHRLFRQTQNRRSDHHFRPRLLALSLGVTLVHWLPMFLWMPHYMRSIGLPLSTAIQREISIALAQVMMGEVALNFIFGLSVFLWDIYPRILLRATVTKERLERDLRAIPRTAMICFFAFAITPWMQLILRGNPRPMGSVGMQESLSMVLGIVITFAIFDWLYLVSRTVDIYLNQRGK